MNNIFFNDSMVISNVWFKKQRWQVIIHINLICVTTVTVGETILYQHKRFAMLSISISFPVPKFINSLETFNNVFSFNTVYFPTQQNSSDISFQCIQVYIEWFHCNCVHVNMLLTFTWDQLSVSTEKMAPTQVLKISTKRQITYGPKKCYTSKMVVVNQ